MRDTKLLTRSEFQVMKILWNLPSQSGYTTDILAQYEEPKPAYTTLATFLKILNNKGFVKCKKRNGKLHYTPAVSQEKYAEIYLAPAKDVFFHGSFAEMMHFLIQKEQITQAEAEDLIQYLQQLTQQS